MKKLFISVLRCKGKNKVSPVQIRSTNRRISSANHPHPSHRETLFSKGDFKDDVRDEAFFSENSPHSKRVAINSIKSLPLP